MGLIDYKGVLVIAGLIGAVMLYNRKALAAAATAVNPLNENNVFSEATNSKEVARWVYDATHAPDGGEVWIGDFVDGAYYGWVPKDQIPVPVGDEYTGGA